MKTYCRIVLFAAILFAAYPALAEPPPAPSPITFSVIVDKGVDERLFGRENFLKRLGGVFAAASSIFEKEIGRPLKINDISFVEPPPDTHTTILAYADKTEKWIEKEFYDTHADKILFITQNRLTFEFDPKLYNGFAVDEKLLIVHFSLFEKNQPLITLLHELGHTCGAKHENNTKRIMHVTTTDIISFDEKNRAIIKKNCGPN